jgi:hypothetical protein
MVKSYVTSYDVGIDEILLRLREKHGKTPKRFYFTIPDSKK